MSVLKRLISDTAIYGTSSILAKGLNYLLTFLIAKIVAPSEFGIFIELYAFVAFIQVVLTHGMETSFFRHVNILDKEKNVFGTAFLSVSGFASLFLLLALLLLDPIAVGLQYPDQKSYVAVFAFIIFFDVISAIPFANLRQIRKAKAFASIKIFEIILTILLNIFFLFGCPYIIQQQGSFAEWVSSWFQEDNLVLFVFVANLLASISKFLMLVPSMTNISLKIEKAVYKRMFSYALPVMVMGFAGVINEMFDRAALRRLLPYNDETNQTHVAIYGFAYKISMVITLTLQAYRYAVEPMLFAETDQKKAPPTYALIMKYYVIGIVAIIIMTLFNLPLMNFILVDLLDYPVEYANSFKIAPVLLVANALLGIYFNISIWYKITDKTKYGAYIAIVGAIVTIALNIWWIPIYGYVGSAWATLICYTIMTSIGLWIGQKYYPIPYAFKRISLYLFIALISYGIYLLMGELDWYFFTIVSLVMTGVFLAIVLKLERGSKTT